MIFFRNVQYVSEVANFRSHKLWNEYYFEPGIFLKTLIREIDQVASFHAAKTGSSIIEARPDARRELHVEVPPNTLGEETREGPPNVGPVLRSQWRDEASKAHSYARSKGVVLDLFTT
jgi:hypothetical protein